MAGALSGSGARSGAGATPERAAVSLHEAATAIASAREKSRRSRTRSSPRRREIIEIAATMFAERGFHGTTIRDIAERAEILSGSLYHHFRSKETIVDEILRQYWDELFESYEQILRAELEPADRIRELFRVSVSLIDTRAPALRLLLADFRPVADVLPYVEANMALIETVWTASLDDGIERGRFTADLDSTLAYRTMMSAISGTGRWYDGSGPLTSAQIVESMQNVFLRGLSAIET